MRNAKKGAILFIVLAVILVVVILSGVILSIVSSQSRLTHHQVSRIKAYYASKGVMNYALEMLRTGVWKPGASKKYACHKGCIDSVTASYIIPDDTDIPYRIQVTIWPNKKANNPLLDTLVTQIDIKTQYTYTP